MEISVNLKIDKQTKFLCCLSLLSDNCCFLDWSVVKIIPLSSSLFCIKEIISVLNSKI